MNHLTSFTASMRITLKNLQQKALAKFAQEESTVQDNPVVQRGLTARTGIRAGTTTPASPPTGTTTPASPPKTSEVVNVSSLAL